MKHLSCILFICFLNIATLLAQKPEWVKTHPYSDNEYIGIGLASTSDDNYINKATDNALRDIAGQIASRVEVSSFMHVVDVDGKSRELFDEKIKNSMTSYLEGHKLIDSYQDENNYYVYYSLDKNLYERNLNSYKQRAIKDGLDFYLKAEQAINTNSLVNAAQLLGKGLEVVSPWIFMDLTTTFDGKTFDVPTELYNAYLNIFDGLAITTNEVNITAEAFKPINKPIAGCLSKNGTVVSNVKLKAEFVVGSGAITPPVATDYNGTSEFYITNITSKLPVQEIRISIDDSFITSLPESYRHLIQSQTWPSAKITIALAQQAVTAYINVSNDDLTSCKRQITSLLTNQHFTITEDPDTALCFIDLSTSLDVGGTVSNDLGDLNECLCTLILKIYNNQTQELLLNYTIDNLRVLSPANKSIEQTEMMCVREIMKRVNRELPKRIKNLIIN